MLQWPFFFLSLYRCVNISAGGIPFERMCHLHFVRYLEGSVAVGWIYLHSCQACLRVLIPACFLELPHHGSLQIAEMAILFKFAFLLLMQNEVLFLWLELLVFFLVLFYVFCLSKFATIVTCNFFGRYLKFLCSQIYLFLHAFRFSIQKDFNYSKIIKKLSYVFF